MKSKIRPKTRRTRQKPASYRWRLFACRLFGTNSRAIHSMDISDGNCEMRVNPIRRSQRRTSAVLGARLRSAYDPLVKDKLPDSFCYLLKKADEGAERKG